MTFGDYIIKFSSVFMSAVRVIWKLAELIVKK